MDYYNDDLDMDSVPRRASRYSRDHDRDYLDDRRDRYDYDRDLDYRGSYPPLPDDPLYRMMSRPLLPHPRDSMRDVPFKDPLPEGAVPLGSVVLIPANPLDPKPSRREKPPSCKTVFVGSLPDTCNEKNLSDLFSKCGNIVEVRVSRGRNFGHVQFSLESSVDRAMELSGCTVRVENSTSPKDCSKVHVDYAQDKAELDLRRRMRDNEIMAFNTANATSISTDLHRDDIFCYAAKNVKNWLEKGACDSETSNTFFGLVSSINSHARKVAKNIQLKDEDELEFKLRKRDYMTKLEKEGKEVCII